MNGLWALIMAMMADQMHDMDENGVCKDCGADLSSLKEKAPQYKPVKQTTHYINAPTLQSGDVLKVAPPVVDKDGNIVGGDYYATIEKESAGIYVVKRVGQG